MPKTHGTKPTFVKTITSDSNNKISIVATVSAGLQLQVNVLLEGLIGIFIGVKPYFAYTYSVALQDCKQGGKKIASIGNVADMCLATSDKKTIGVAIKFGGSLFGKDIASVTLANLAFDLGGASKALGALKDEALAKGGELVKKGEKLVGDYTKKGEALLGNYSKKGEALLGDYSKKGEALLGGVVGSAGDAIGGLFS
jgi:hypothetical protein